MYKGAEEKNVSFEEELDSFFGNVMNTLDGIEEYFKSKGFKGVLLYLAIKTLLIMLVPILYIFLIIGITLLLIKLFGVGPAAFIQVFLIGFALSVGLYLADELYWS